MTRRRRKMSDEEDNDQPGVTIRFLTLGDKRRRIV
jgi:hypothetical protein